MCVDLLKKYGLLFVQFLVTSSRSILCYGSATPPFCSMVLLNLQRGTEPLSLSVLNVCYQGTIVTYLEKIILTAVRRSP